MGRGEGGSRRRRFHKIAKSAGYDLECEAIGEGSFGTVFRGIDRRDDRARIVLKRIRHDGYDEDEYALNVACEVSVLAHLGSHPHIVKLRKVMCTPVDTSLVLDDAGESLCNLIQARVPLCEPMLSAHLLTALSYCHARGVVHRDIKPANLGVARISQDNDLRLRVLDFGTSVRIDDHAGMMTNAMGTYPYSAPEMLLGDNTYGAVVDVWSAGCVIAEMVTKKRLFCTLHQIDTIMAIFRLRGTPNRKRWPDTAALRGFKEFESSPEPTRFPQCQPKHLGHVITGGDESLLYLLDACLQCDARLRVTSVMALQCDYVAPALWKSSLAGDVADV